MDLLALIRAKSRTLVRLWFCLNYPFMKLSQQISQTHCNKPKTPQPFSA